MKTFVILLIGMLAAGAQAQSTNLDRTLQSTSTHLTLEKSALAVSQKPAQMVAGRFTYSGIAVQAIKARNPLQLINPFAPAEYGSGQDNVVLGTRPGKVTGVKFLAISF